VTDKMPAEPADLVDVFFADLVRPLGNLVILYAQAEAALIELWVELDGCTEGEAQKILWEPPRKVQQQITAHPKTVAMLHDYIEELSEGIKNFYSDRQQRHRLIHDEWDVSLLECDAGWRAEPITRGIPRKSPTEVVWRAPKPGDVWNLALRFRGHRSLFTSLSRVLRDSRMSGPTLRSDPAATNFCPMHRINSGDRLFSSINNFLVIVSAISYAAPIMVDGGVHKEQNPLMRVNTRQFDYAFLLPLRASLLNALENKSPPYIEIGTTSNVDELLEGAKINTVGLRSVMTNVICPIFIMFFERYNVWLKSNHGDPVNWPAVLNFCRVVRNACAHGSIDFRNLQTAPVSWRGLSFGPSDNGRHIIGTEVSAGDILGLMFEASTELDKIKAPRI
jgi:hypothetical protein